VCGEGILGWINTAVEHGLQPLGVKQDVLKPLQGFG
jgi:hypothetical protein